jgi:hypothetical protein
MSAEPENNQQLSDDESDSSSMGGNYRIKTQLSGRNNYEIWLEEEKILWEEKGVFDHLTDKVEKPQGAANSKTVKKWRKRDTRAKRCILGNCEEAPRRRLIGATTGLAMLSNLQDLYGLTGFTVVQGFYNILHRLNNGDHSSVEETDGYFIQATQGLVRMHKEMDAVQRTHIYITAFQHTYPDWYQRWRAKLTELGDATTKTFNITESTLSKIMSDLTDHASQNKPVRPQQQQAHRNWTETRNAGNGGQIKRFNSWRDHYTGDGCTKKCDYCIREKGWLGHGHTEETCSIKDPTKRRFPPPGQQQNSGSNTASNLPAADYIPQRYGGGEDGNKKHVKIMEMKEEPDSKKRKVIHIARVFQTKLESTQHVWQYDTAASIHVCNERAGFLDLKEDSDSLPYVVTLGGFVKPEGIGSVLLRTVGRNGTEIEIELQGVYYMPNSPVNLLSGTKLLSQGYYYDARNGVLCNMDDGDELGVIDFDGDTITLRLHDSHINELAEKLRTTSLSPSPSKNGQHS